MVDVFTLNNYCVDKLEISMVIAVAIHKAVESCGDSSRHD